MRLALGDLVEHEGQRGRVQCVTFKEVIVWTRSGHLKIFSLTGEYLRTHKRGAFGQGSPVSKRSQRAR